MGSKVDYRIIAVDERDSLVSNLLRQLGASDDSKVFWDHDRNGCMWNAYRAWSSFLKDSGEASHCIVFADDVQVIEGFWEVVEHVAEAFPEHLFSRPATRFMDASYRGKFTPYIEIANNYVHGAFIMAPRKHIKGYLDFYDKWFRGTPWPHDDATWRLYCFLNHVPTMTSVPSLVYLEQVPSQMQGHKMFGNGDVWEGRDVDISQYMTNDYVVSPNINMNLHDTRKDFPEELKKLVMGEKRRRARLKKLMNG